MARFEWETLITYRRWFLVLVLVITGILAMFARGITLDPSMESLMQKDSPEYARYKQFTDVFQNEEFILVGAKIERQLNEANLLNKVASITSKLEKLDDIAGVLSITNLKTFQQTKGGFKNARFVVGNSDTLSLPQKEECERIRTAFPMTDVLLSRDRRKVAFIIRIKDEFKSDVAYLADLKKNISYIFQNELGPGWKIGMAGLPIIREAIQRYNFQTLFRFVVLAALIGVLTSVYIFKGKHAAVAFAVMSCVSAIWLTGLMSLLDISLNMISLLSFGLVLIMNVSGAIHIVSHYFRHIPTSPNCAAALSCAYNSVGRACFMCAITTSIGFAGLTTATSPLVQDLGIIMAIAVMASFVLLITVAPFVILAMSAPSQSVMDMMSRDSVSSTFTSFRHVILFRSKSCLVVGLTVSFIMIVGATFIKPETNLFHFLRNWTQEMQDFRYIENSIAPLQSLEILLETEPKGFRESPVWRRIAGLEAQLNNLPYVRAKYSLLSFLEYLHGRIMGKDSEGGNLFTKPGIVNELITITSFTPGGKALLRRYLNDTSSVLRISVFVNSPPDKTLKEIFNDIFSLAKTSMKGVAKVSATGFFEAYATHASGFIRSQVVSLSFAVVLVTIVMMWQFQSVSMGLVGLIPNVVPLFVIFGFMGWFGIPLDPGTSCIATVCIGLCVDDTIHFLTQVRSQMRKNSGLDDLGLCLMRAYDVSGRALISTSVVLFLPFLVLLWSPFRPVAMFGLLGAIAVFTALLADLAFMPAVIMRVGFVRSILSRQAELDSSAKTKIEHH